jgi:hypothetical protein
MDPSPYDVIVAIAASQWDLFTAQQAFQAGLTPAGLRWNCRPGGPFERVARGVYRLRDVPPQPCVSGSALSSWPREREPWPATDRRDGFSGWMGYRRG